MTDQGWDVARVAARGAKAFWSWLGRCRGGDSEDLTEGCASLGRLKQMAGWTSDEQTGSGSLGGFVFLFVKSNLLFLTDYSWTFGFWNYPDGRILQKKKKTDKNTVDQIWKSNLKSPPNQGSFDIHVRIRDQQTSKEKPCFFWQTLSLNSVSHSATRHSRPIEVWLSAAPLSFKENEENETPCI